MLWVSDESIPSAGCCVRLSWFLCVIICVVCKSVWLCVWNLRAIKSRGCSDRTAGVDNPGLHMSVGFIMLNVWVLCAFEVNRRWRPKESKHWIYIDLVTDVIEHEWSCCSVSAGCNHSKPRHAFVILTCMVILCAFLLANKMQLLQDYSVKLEI